MGMKYIYSTVQYSTVQYSTWEAEEGVVVYAILLVVIVMMPCRRKIISKMKPSLVEVKTSIAELVIVVLCTVYCILYNVCIARVPVKINHCRKQQIVGVPNDYGYGDREPT